MRLGYDLMLWNDFSVKKSITIDLDTHCHTLLTGSSGSGKSYGLLYLLGQAVKSYPDIHIFFCDFKKSTDFNFLTGYEGYFAGDDCMDGILAFEGLFETCRQSGASGARYLLIIDEYPSMLNYLQGADKRNKTKVADEIAGIIARLLMLGRGLHFYVWLTTQRADASLFASGARDNFMNLVSLGHLSKEQKTMLFTGQDLPDRIYGKGEGLVLSDGRPILEIKIPVITDVEDWKRHILTILADRRA